MHIYTTKLCSDDKYFSIETQEKLLNILNRKKSIKIPNL